MRKSVALRTLVGAASLALPLMAVAESNVQTGAATAAPGAKAHVDFAIVIPKILYLRVGTGSNYTIGILAANAVKNLIRFTPTAAQVGNGVAVAGASIPFTQIRTTATAAFYPALLPALLPAPVLQNGASANILITAPASKIIKTDARWTFTYANANLPPAGTYGGVNVRNGRVLYTATMP